MAREKRKADTTEPAQVDLPTSEVVERVLQREQYRSSFLSGLRSTINALIVVAAVAVLIAVMILPVIQINGSSMTDTLRDGDIVVALTHPRCRTGDVLAFYYNNNILVKRVIASAGQWVDIDADGNVFVNGQRLEEPYVTEKSLGECDLTLPYQVPDKKLFVMGDHRATSTDSRNSAIGCIDDELVVGRILLVVWPLANFGFVQ